MIPDNIKIQILLKLGAPKGNAWPDYLTLYGFLEEDVPALIELLNDGELIDLTADCTENWAPQHAWRVLGQLRSEQSIGAIIDSFDILFENDAALRELGSVIGMIGPAAIDLLSQHLQQPGKHELSYVLAMESLYEIASSFPRFREQVFVAYRKYLAKPWESNHMLNALLVGRLTDLNAAEMIDDIRHLFSRNCVDVTCAGDLQDVEILLGIRDKRTRPKQLLQLLEQLMPARLEEFDLSADNNGENKDFDNIIDHWLMLHESDKAISSTSELDGYFAAIACCPETILPSVWKPEIWGGAVHAPIWEHAADFNQFNKAVLGLYNRVMAELKEDSYEPAFMGNTRNVNALPVVADWCEGFIRGLGLWHTLLPESRTFLSNCIVPMQTFGTEQGTQSLDSMRVGEIAKLQDEIGINTLKLYRHFSNPARS